MCRDTGRELPEVLSAADNAALVSLVGVAYQNQESDTAWYVALGGHDSVQPNQWEWESGAVWGYSNWASGQPSDSHGGREDRLEIAIRRDRFDSNAL